MTERVGSLAGEAERALAKKIVDALKQEYAHDWSRQEKIDRITKLLAVSTPPVASAPIQLNSSTEDLIKSYGHDRRLWANDDTTEFNLRVFARAVLAANWCTVPAAQAVAGEAVDKRIRNQRKELANLNALLRETQLRLTAFLSKNPEEIAKALKDTGINEIVFVEALVTTESKREAAAPAAAPLKRMMITPGGDIHEHCPECVGKCSDIGTGTPAAPFSPPSHDERCNATETEINDGNHYLHCSASHLHRKNSVAPSASQAEGGQGVVVISAKPLAIGEAGKHFALISKMADPKGFE